MFGDKTNLPEKRINFVVKIMATFDNASGDDERFLIKNRKLSFF